MFNIKYWSKASKDIDLTHATIANIKGKKKDIAVLETYYVVDPINYTGFD